MAEPEKGNKSKGKILEACPHCGYKLSPWQQVLLNVDRVITCKNCWYRIMLDVFEDEDKSREKGKDKQKTKGK